MDEAVADVPVSPRPAGDMEPPRCVFSATAFLPDSPAWCAQERRLVWVDILASAVHFGDPCTGETTTMPVPALIGSLAPAQSGGFVAALQNSFARLDPTDAGFAHWRILKTTSPATASTMANAIRKAASGRER